MNVKYRISVIGIPEEFKDLSEEEIYEKDALCIPLKSVELTEEEFTKVINSISYQDDLHKNDDNDSNPYKEVFKKLCKLWNKE